MISRDSTDLISINGVSHRKKREKVMLLHKFYPFVPTIMQNVPLNLPFLLESRYPGNCEWALCSI